MSEKLNTIIEQLKSLTLLEAAELVKEIEVVFGVDTSMSVGTMAAAPAAAASRPLQSQPGRHQVRQTPASGPRAVPSGWA